jgi:hypothetical protein
VRYFEEGCLGEACKNHIFLKYTTVGQLLKVWRKYFREEAPYLAKLLCQLTECFCFLVLDTVARTDPSVIPSTYISVSGCSVTLFYFRRVELVNSFVNDIIIKTL